MGLLTRWDRRNQRIVEKQRQLHEPDEDAVADDPVVATGSVASCLPGVAGVIGAVVAAVAAVWRLKRKRSA
jgi:hypothetical protein